MNNVKPYILFFICLTFPKVIQAQEFEYLGIIQLNDSSFISYKLVFDKVNDSIKGYSLTDFAGKHETKSNIRGYYDSQNNWLTFEEYDIVYTKSPVIQEDFCFVHFSGKVTNLDRARAFDGSFRGLYGDGQKCIDGKIVVNDQDRIRKRVAKIDRVIQRSRKVSDSVKKNIRVTRILDTLTRNIIARGENLNIFSRDQKIKLMIYDAGKEDSDIINLIVDGKLILENYIVTKAKRILDIRLVNPETIIRVEAVSAGTSPPNTVRLEVEDTRNFVRTITNLDAGQHATMTILKK